MSWVQDVLRKLAAPPPRAARRPGRPAGSTQSPEARARISEASKRALADPEVRARMSEASKRAWADPEVRARMSEAKKRALADPEVRARMSEAKKRALAGAPKDLQVPRWVPADLVGEFFEMAAAFGEERAASHVRMLKREALR